MSTTQQTVAQAIHAALTAADNCRKSGNSEWLKRWGAFVTRISRECLPSGSGIDNGTRVLELTRDKAGFVLLLDYHHMNGDGFYTGWSEYRVTVRPTFSGLHIRIEGPRLSDVGDYLTDVLDAALQAEMPETLTP